MRFAELQLIRYGRFEDCSLRFGQGDIDLQLILGPNEAGKSTALAAVSDLLFGFETRTRFAFRFDQRLLRLGAVLEAQGDRLEIRRRKGTAKTLLDPEEQPIDDALLSAHLGGQTRDSFERMFGLDHGRLREGGKAMLAAKDDVGAAIFAAGSGLVQVARVCEELEAEAKAIWTRSAGESRRYTAAHSAYQAAKAKLKGVEVRPAAWTKARKELEVAEAELEALKSERAALTQQHRAVQRRQLVLPPTARREQALRRIAELGPVPELSPDAARRCETALDEAQTARAAAIAAQAEIDRLAQELEGVRPRPELLEIAPEIVDLRELKGVVDQGLAKLAALTADRDNRWARIRTSVAEIGWPDEPPPALKLRLPGRPAVADLRQLIEDRRGLDEQSRSTSQAAREAAATKRRLEAELDALPATPDVRPLQDLVRELRAAGHSHTRQQAEADTEELEQVLRARLRAMAPWSGDVTALLALEPPLEDDADHALARLKQAREAVEDQVEACDRERARGGQMLLERKQAVLAHPAPDLHAQEQARVARGGAWAPLKAHLHREAMLHDVDAATSSYEQAVLDADRIADERFASAEHAGGLAALEREIEKSDLQLSQAETRLAAARAEVEAAQAAFAALVAPLGVTLSPEAYPRWRDAHAHALEAAHGLELARADRLGAREAEELARRRLAAALGRTPEGETLQGLLDHADRLIDAAGDARARERELRGQLTAAQQMAERAEQQAQTAAEAETAWSSSWAPALTRAGLPPDASVAVTRAQLDIIEALRGNLERVLELDNQLDAIRQSGEEFEQRVAAAARRVDVAAAPDCIALYAALQALAAEALAKAERARTLEATLDQARTKLSTSEATIAEAEIVLSPLAAAGPEGDTAERRILLMRSTEAGRLRALVEELEAEILGHGHGRPLNILIAEVSDADPEVLAAQSDQLAEQIDELNTGVEAKSAIRQAAHAAFTALDDRPDAAVAAFEIAEARSEMAFQAELYIRKRAESRLLRTAVERYRQQKQGPLLARASALFATLTLGGFSRLMVDYDGDTARLAGVRTDAATVVPVEGMSEGTVDQLFLALRIAAIEDAVAQGVRLPFVADDLFINFDDERAAAGFKVLAELSRKTQVLFFTHHTHLADVAEAALGCGKISVCGLDREAPSAGASATNAA